MCYLYIILCKDNTLYTGITNNLKKRFLKHKNKKGAHYTRSHGVIRIVYKEKYPTREKALKREKEIKSWRREKKLGLIKMSYN